MKSVWQDRVFGLHDTGLSNRAIAQRISEERGVPVSAKEVGVILKKNEPHREYNPTSLTDRSSWEPITQRVAELQSADKTLKGPEIKQSVREEFGEEVRSCELVGKEVTENNAATFF